MRATPRAPKGAVRNGARRLESDGSSMWSGGQSPTFGDIERAKSVFRKGRARSDLLQPTKLFQDKEMAKTAALQRICSPEAMQSINEGEGCMGVLVNSHPWTYFSLALVLGNSLWIAIETDNDESDSWCIGHWIVSIDSLFCLLFIFELMVRVMALKRLRFWITDAWLVFDTLMALLNIFEAWVLPWTTDEKVGSDGASGPLRLLRVLRLSRIARTLMIFRLIPELALLIRSITQALRAVFAVVCLLLLFVYVSALYFTNLARDTNLESRYFPDVTTSMKSLIVRGTLLDGTAIILDHLGEESALLTILFVCFIFVTACLLLNMLVGVLVEVVTVTAAVEHEEYLGRFIMEAFMAALKNIGHDGDRKVTKRQVERIVRQGSMNEVLRVLDISMDRRTLLEYIFEPEGGAVESVQISSVVLTLLQLRSTAPATVRDVLDARRIVLHRLGQVETLLKQQSASSLTPNPRRSLQKSGSKGTLYSTNRRSFHSVFSSEGGGDLSPRVKFAERAASTISPERNLSQDLCQEFSQMALRLCELREQVQRDMARTGSKGTVTSGPEGSLTSLNDLPITERLTQQEVPCEPATQLQNMVAALSPEDRADVDTYATGTGDTEAYHNCQDEPPLAFDTKGAPGEVFPSGSQRLLRDPISPSRGLLGERVSALRHNKDLHTRLRHDNVTAVAAVSRASSLRGLQSESSTSNGLDEGPGRPTATKPIAMEPVSFAGVMPGLPASERGLPTPTNGTRPPSSVPSSLEIAPGDPDPPLALTL